jgi:hypothetical protein
LPRCTSGMELHQKRWKPLLKARLARLGGFSTVPRNPIKRVEGSGGKPDQWDTGCPCWQGENLNSHILEHIGWQGVAGCDTMNSITRKGDKKTAFNGSANPPAVLRII